MFLSAMKAMDVENLDIIHGDEKGWNGHDDTIKVNGIPFWEFMEKKKKKNEILMDHVVLITRIFDHRVKSFFKHIIMFFSVFSLSYIGIS